MLILRIIKRTLKKNNNVFVTGSSSQSIDFSKLKFNENATVVSGSFVPSVDSFDFSIKEYELFLDLYNMYSYTNYDDASWDTMWKLVKHSLEENVLLNNRTGSGRNRTSILNLGVKFGILDRVVLSNGSTYSVTDIGRKLYDVYVLFSETNGVPRKNYYGKQDRVYSLVNGEFRKFLSGGRTYLYQMNRVCEITGEPMGFIFMEGDGITVNTRGLMFERGAGGELALLKDTISRCVGFDCVIDFTVVVDGGISRIYAPFNLFGDNAFIQFPAGMLGEVVRLYGADVECRISSSKVGLFNACFDGVFESSGVEREAVYGGLPIEVAVVKDGVLVAVLVGFYYSGRLRGAVGADKLEYGSDDYYFRVCRQLSFVSLFLGRSV